MTQRERFLSMLVGGTLIAVGIWWMLGKYQKAVRTRSNEITNLEQQQQKLVEQQLQGEYANRQMGEYVVRSLPGDLQTAQSRYQSWLLWIMQDNYLRDRSVDPTSPRQLHGLYEQLSYRVQGKATIPELVDLLHDFYSTDYLHRIKSLSVRPSREGDFIVEMTVDAISLLAAPAELPEPTDQSWQVSADTAEYREPILDRNFFEPPNNAPQFAGSSTIEAIVGQQTTKPLVFKDAEDHSMKFELIDPAVDFVSIDERTGTLRVAATEKNPIELKVRVTDDGYPRRVTEQALTINVVDPPPPPAPPAPKLKFDDAKQTVLTGLVQGRGEWTAWMRVRTRDTTLKLRVGDTFEVGSVKGTVIEVNQRCAMLEIDGQKYQLKPNEILRDATESESQE